MKILLGLFLVFNFAVAANGQKNVKDLLPSHAIALEDFLSKNKKYSFMSENNIDAEYLADMRKYNGKTLKPYYVTGDFNKDKITDFAIILARKGQIKQVEDLLDYPYDYDHPLSVVIFNGKRKGGFTTAFIEDVEVPLVCLLMFTGKKKELLFALYGSDAETMIFTPIGKGYIIETPPAP